MLDDLDLAWEEQQEYRRRRGGTKGRQARQNRRKERKRRSRSIGALFISLVLLAGLGGGVYWGVGKLQDMLGAPDYETNPATVPVTIVVNQGDGGIEIGNELYDKKVVKSARAFVNEYEANKSSRNIQPGQYRLFQEMPARLALAMLLDPDKNMIVNKVTITEGMVTVDIYAKLSKATGVPVADFVQAGKDPAAVGIDASWFARRDDGRRVIKSIEGFLFPATYSFAPGLTAKEILSQMVQKFISVADELHFQETVQANLSITPYEALIAASIAQVEAVFPEDYPKVARVLYNRAYSGKFPCSCLGLDSEVNYWLKISGKKPKASEHLTVDELHDPKDPYNTHDLAGMPGGAISNPGEEALKGAMSPAANMANYFYFISVDKAGHMAYARNDAEHSANIRLACKNGVPLC